MAISEHCTVLVGVWEELSAESLFGLSISWCQEIYVSLFILIIIIIIFLNRPYLGNNDSWF